MNAKPVLPRNRLSTTIVAALASAIISIGLLSAVSAAFLRDGAPLEQIVAAEQACADRAFVSQREMCMNSYLVASRHQRIASR